MRRNAIQKNGVARQDCRSMELTKEFVGAIKNFSANRDGVEYNESGVGKKMLRARAKEEMDKIFSTDDAYNFVSKRHLSKNINCNCKRIKACNIEMFETRLIFLWVDI